LHPVRLLKARRFWWGFVAGVAGLWVLGGGLGRVRVRLRVGGDDVGGDGIGGGNAGIFGTSSRAANTQRAARQSRMFSGLGRFRQP
jgi:hypothetical protein